MVMNKSFTNKFNDIGGNLQSEDIDLINRFTVNPLTADEVFCFNITLCDNEIDRDFERFSLKAIEALSEMFVGKTGIMDHNPKSENQSARIFKTWVEQDADKQTTSCEPYTALRARAYMPITEKNKDIITEIKAGIKKEISIGCSIKSCICSVCGTDIRKKACKHRKSEIYNGGICHYILDNPADAYEFSFVAIPAQPEAGVTKSFEPNGTEARSGDDVTVSLETVKQLSLEINRLKKLNKQSEFFRGEFEAEVTALAALALPDIDTNDFAELCKELSLERLSMLKNAFKKRAAESFPLAPQLGKAEKSENHNNNFNI